MSKLRTYCNSCNNLVWHDVSAERKQRQYVHSWGYEQDVVAQILRCKGCDTFLFRLVLHPFEFQDEKDEPEEFIYPERSLNKRPEKFLPMPPHIYWLYKETVAAHNHKLNILSAAGLRSLLEAIVVNKIDNVNYGRNLESKINALAPLFEPGVIAVLHEFRKAGNDALHSQAQSDHLDIHRALNVVDGIMEYFYGVSNSAELYSDLKKPKVRKRKRTVA